MLEKDKQLYSAKAPGTIEKMAQEILRNIPKEHKILKIVFFIKADGPSNYLSTRASLAASLQEAFPTETPLLSYVAQETADGLLRAEVITLADSNATIERHSNHIILSREGTRELMTGGIIPHNLEESTYAQSLDIFEQIKTILDASKFAINDIYRQWNYIEGITIESDGSQNYQEFNDARSLFYAGAEWSNGYPAATGIGSSAGGVMVDLYALSSPHTVNRPIDNPLQIAAHNYSKQVLADNRQTEKNEKSTPKFERARLTAQTIHISGTAAIRGEASSPDNDILAQTEATMQIMNHLVSPENIPTPCNATEYDFLRIYVKHKSHIPLVQEYMQAHYPAPLKHYLVSDICRPELLIEIEGTAHIQP